MRTVIPFILLSTLAFPAAAQDIGAPPAPARTIHHPTSASRPPLREGPLIASAEREGSRLATRPLRRLQQPGTNGPKSNSWISRHPALFGALVGAGGGAVAAGTMENELFCSGGDEDCFFHGGNRLLVGAGMGAGIGALVGWLVGL
jgi:hypothetical protein